MRRFYGLYGELGILGQEQSGVLEPPEHPPAYATDIITVNTIPIYY